MLFIINIIHLPSSKPTALKLTIYKYKIFIIELLLFVQSYLLLKKQKYKFLVETYL